MVVNNIKNLRKETEGDDVTGLQKLKNSGVAALKGDAQTATKQAPTAGGDSTTASEKTKDSAPAWEYKPYTPSEAVSQALLQQQLGNKPGAYSSQWQDQLNDILQKILNREPFSYDLNGDILYQQYKDHATTQGKMAMMDAMGQAAAMTGGHGNSYAQAVGQQAYQGHLQQLNDKVPELYQLALSQYNKEGDDMYNQASLMAGMEEQEYGRHRDELEDYYAELSRLTDDARYQAEQEYGRWADEQNFTYQQWRDQISDQQWQAQFEEAQRQFNETNKKRYSSGGGSGGGKSAVNLYGAAIGSAVGAAASALGGKPAQGGKPSYGDIVKDLNDLVALGTNKSEISAIIRDAVQDGYITQNQAQALMKTYVPRGYAY